MFAQAGTVTEVALIKDRESGRSKGFGFVTMGSQSEMEEAIRMFNGHSLDDRQLTVNIARPREERSGRGGFGGGGGGRGYGGGGGGGGYGGGRSGGGKRPGGQGNRGDSRRY